MTDIVCTKQRPWNRTQRPPRGDGSIQHPDAHIITDNGALKPSTMVCPHCGVTFTSQDG